jgi:hypothetical protein
MATGHFAALFKDGTNKLAAIPKGFRTLIIALKAGEIINGRLNPTHFATATSAYHIQARTLRVPNRFGFFSSGPHRLQVREASIFICLVGSICFTVILFGFMIYPLTLGPPGDTVKLLAVVLSLVVFKILLFWVLDCSNPRRAPGYQWENWKLRND